MKGSRNLYRLAVSAAAIALLSSVAGAQTRWTQSLLMATNSTVPNQSGIIDFQSSNTGALTVASGTQSFTGLDRNGGLQTMTFTGEVRNSAEFGQLHAYATGQVVNTYYNSSNPTYTDPNTGVNPLGSPDSLASLGFAGFTDTLHYGGQLQSGYRARYVFHVDGTNSGYGVLADMAVSIAGNPYETFFAFTDGFTSEIWATQSYEINGITPQEVNVQFSNQFVVNTYDVDDGSTIGGTSDFSSTLTLARIDVTDSFGNLVNGVTVTSDSGTTYPVPEPASMLVLGGGLVALLRRRKRA